MIRTSLKVSLHPAYEQALAGCLFIPGSQGLLATQNSQESRPRGMCPFMCIYEWHTIVQNMQCT